MHTWIQMKMNIYNIYTVCLPVLVSIDDNNRMGRGWGGDGTHCTLPAQAGSVQCVHEYSIDIWSKTRYRYCMCAATAGSGRSV